MKFFLIVLYHFITILIATCNLYLNNLKLSSYNHIKLWLMLSITLLNLYLMSVAYLSDYLSSYKYLTHNFEIATLVASYYNLYRPNYYNWLFAYTNYYTITIITYYYNWLFAYTITIITKYTLLLNYALFGKNYRFND